MNRNIPYYIAAVVVFICLKLAHTLAGTEDLVFLLKPTHTLVEWITGSHSVFLAGKGYYLDRVNILIDKSCSGFNFWLLSFLVFTYLTVNHLQKPLHKMLVLPAALLGAYLLTIFANTSRIFASIVVQNQTKNTLPHHQHLLHEAVGIITYLTFLVLAYYLIYRYILYKQHHEKLA